MTTVSSAVAPRDNTPASLVRSYSGDFTQVMPSHVKPDAWVRIAVGALKRGKKIEAGEHRGRYELEVAAQNNPGVFLAALLDAARLGLEPGTEQYYLTPRKVKGQLEILGIVGYQGIIELMYRAGAVSSVIAECVYSRDEFAYQPGVDTVPVHRIDWDADERGDLRLVYAYARMRDGATSKVVVLNKTAIAAIKSSSQGANSEYSPWQKHPASMWLKSAVRQLAKWVPTSSEYVNHDTKATPASAAVAAPVTTRAAVEAAPEPAVDRSTGEILDGELLPPDGDVQVEEPPYTEGEWPPVTPPADA